MRHGIQRSYPSQRSHDVQRATLRATSPSLGAPRSPERAKALKISPKLLWVDCSAAAMAGVFVLALSGWLSGFHGLPRSLLIFVGAVNLLYGAYSFSLAVRVERSPALIKLLVCGNACWAIACVVLATSFLGRATVFGLAHLYGEAILVGGLAALEWHQRHHLVRRRYSGAQSP